MKDRVIEMKCIKKHACVTRDILYVTEIGVATLDRNYSPGNPIVD